jgi:putative PEP-CTERM system histidine kinase
MNFADYLFLAAGIWPLVLAAFALRLSPGKLSHWTFAAGILLLAAYTSLARVSLGATDFEAIARLERWRLMLASFLPAVWIPFSLSYARGNHQEFVKKWRVVLWSTWVLPVLAFASFPYYFSRPAPGMDTGLRSTPLLEWPAVIIHLAILTSVVLIVVNLERTFRAAVGTLRWRIKFAILGLGLLFAVRFYSSSQVLSFSAPDTTLAHLNASALVLACALITVSIVRTRRAEIEVYPSLAVLERSITVLLAGLYLVVVGVLANVTAKLGGDRTFAFKSFLILLSIVALGLLLVSDRSRFLGRRLISRHFRRSLYDYRTLWRTFSERTNAVVDERTYCRELANIISETLEVLTVTAWLPDETRSKLTLVASTSLSESADRALPDPLIDAGKVSTALAGRSEPFALDDARDEWASELKRSNPIHFPRGGGRVCVPISGKGAFLGLLIVGDRVNGVPYSVEDFELLKSIGDQAAGGLLNAQLAQRLLRAREMEAFQSMAAFFVHDLKNTASSLSLMLQNLPQQMENPEFRGDALRAVTKGVGRLNDLIGRLSLLREKQQMKRADSDLKPVLQAALESLGPVAGVTVVPNLESTPTVLMDPEQIQKVAINLLINAREAVSAGGEIRVASFRENGWAVFSVRDNGCGISPEFLRRSLFRPFQTTKKTGIGIGMFHCKTIVDAHQGRIEVESQPGQGTTFRVLLPIEGGTK